MEKKWKQIKENKNKIILFLLITIIAICGFTWYGKNRAEKQTISAEIEEYGVSQTTVPDGYTGIYNAEDLANVNNNLSGKYILMADIDMTGKNHTIIGQSSSFAGIFDGNFHKISNLTIESANQYVGMFGNVLSCTIKNIRLENINIKGTISTEEQYIGGLIGRSYGAIIEGIEIEGCVIEEIENPKISYIGGLVGKAVTNSTIKYSYADINIIGGTGINYIGGLVGELRDATINESYSKGDILIGSGGGVIGGLVGSVYNSAGSYAIKDAYSTVNINGNVIFENNYVGGLIGYINRKKLICI